MQLKLKTKIDELLYKNVFLRKLYRMNFAKVIEAKIILEFLEPKRDQIICDIGCGTGIQSIEIAKKGCRVYGIDMDKQDMEMAKSIAKGHDCYFQVGDVESLPFEASVFDAVVCICAFEHFERDDRALAELNRVLKPNGSLILSVDSFIYKGIKKELQEKHKNTHQVVHFYSAEELSEKLEKNGFIVDKSKYFINSPISAFFFNLGIRVKLGYLFALVFPIAYPLSAASDQFLGKQNEGYLLAIKAKKTK